MLTLLADLEGEPLDMVIGQILNKAKNLKIPVSVSINLPHSLKHLQPCENLTKHITK